MEHRTRNYVEEYKFPAAYHRASRMRMRCHDVCAQIATWHPFRSHKRSSTGEVSLLLRSHVASVKTKTKAETLVNLVLGENLHDLLHVAIVLEETLKIFSTRATQAAMICSTRRCRTLFRKTTPTAAAPSLKSSTPWRTMADTPKPSNPSPPCVGNNEPRIFALYRLQSAWVSSTRRKADA